MKFTKNKTFGQVGDINSINKKLIKIAKNYGLNDDKINKCLNNEKLENEILED